MTRKDYELLTRVFKNAKPVMEAMPAALEQWYDSVKRCAEELHADNARFDVTMFYRNVGADDLLDGSSTIKLKRNPIS